MALIKCAECGHQVSDAAKTCPGCGAAPRRKTSKFTWFITILFGVPFIIAMVNMGTRPNAPSPPPKPELTAEQKAEQERKTAAANVAAAGALQLKKSMRNPASFKLESAFVVDQTGTVCYEYRAQNGFGGINVSQAILDPKSGAFKTSDAAGFTSQWNKACAGRDGRDVKNAINMFVL